MYILTIIVTSTYCLLSPAPRIPRERKFCNSSASDAHVQKILIRTNAIIYIKCQCMCDANGP